MMLMFFLGKNPNLFCQQMDFAVNIYGYIIVNPVITNNIAIKIKSNLLKLVSIFIFFFLINIAKIPIFKINAIIFPIR